MAANCSNEGCLGEYEERLLPHTARNGGQVIVIDNVPTEVCSECGDVLLKTETISRLEELLDTSSDQSDSDQSEIGSHHEFAPGNDPNDP
jgi:YgiT-type zinc finger domain-containing protein